VDKVGHQKKPYWQLESHLRKKCLITDFISLILQGRLCSFARVAEELFLIQATVFTQFKKLANVIGHATYGSVQA